MKKKNNDREFLKNLYSHGNALMFIAILLVVFIMVAIATANRYDPNKIPETTPPQTTTAKAQETTAGESETTAAQAADNTQATTAAQETTTKSEGSGGKIRITTDDIRVRTEPNADSPAVDVVELGDEFDVISKEGDWIKINLDGEEVYVSAEFTETVSE